MNIKKQLKVVKDNWLIVTALILLVLFFNIGSIDGAIYSSSQGAMPGRAKVAYDSAAESMIAYPPTYGGGFAPEIEERKITKNTNLRSEVENGRFYPAWQKAKQSAKAANAIVLNENVNVYGEGKEEYLQGNYQLKVPVNKYDFLIESLREIGEVQSFRENVQDITEQYSNAEIELEAEKTRLLRYQAMYEEATKVEDKIELNDRIFEQERRVKYLEDRMENLDERVEYSTINFELKEEQSKWARIEVIEFSALVRQLVQSFNTLLSLLFGIVPWLVALLLALVGWKIIKRR